MSGEGSRSTRFAPRNARWAHNHRVTWLADGGASEDLAVFKQQFSPPPPYGSSPPPYGASPPPYGTSSPPYGTSSPPYGNGHGNGHTNGNGNGHGNGHTNGNGNGHGRTLNVSISDGERERLKAEVVYWGLQQSQQGRM